MEEHFQQNSFLWAIADGTRMVLHINRSICSTEGYMSNALQATDTKLETEGYEGFDKVISMDDH